MLRRLAIPLHKQALIFIMGTQLLLCASIPHSKYVQTVSTLEALTGILRPQEISTYTLLTKPHNVFKPKFEPGKVNQIEQYYMKCTTIWNDEASHFELSQPVTEDTQILVQQLFTGEEVKHWTFQISDLPNAGKNTVLVHNYHESTLVHHHTKGEDTAAEEKNEGAELMEIDAPKTHKDSFLQFLEALGYDVVNQYWIKGIRFFYGDIVIEIFKVFIRDDDEPAVNLRLKLKLLDSSNTFQIKTYLNFPKGASVDLLTQGTKDLAKLKESLANLFELEVPDRMFMDTRVARVTP